MCAIVGHIAFDADSILSIDDIRPLNDLMFHRGPDDSGTYASGPVTLAMRRLSIIDVQTGHQPMTTPDGRYTIIFNGEIYNYRELRANLIERGFPIRTNSDTETLLHAFADAGPACLSQLNGMFAIAIWDNSEHTLFLARDRLGVKPLYYAHDRKRLFFSSELTPLERAGIFDLRVDQESVSDLLAYLYVCEPKTIYKNVFQLSPGHHMTIRQDGRINIKRWWSLPAAPEQSISYGDACDQLKELMADAVRLRLRSDVPVGTFLSGGIDSGLITHEAIRNLPDLKSFVIGFKEASYSEVDLAAETARKLSANLITTIMNDVNADMIDNILTSLDEPFGNPSYVPTYLLFQAARNSVSVVLTGDGGDELFGGYPTYQAPYFQRPFRLLPKMTQSMIRKAVEKIPVSHNRISLDYRLKQFVRGASLSAERGHAFWRQVFGIDEQLPLYREKMREALSAYDPFENYEDLFARAVDLDPINRFMFADVHTYLLSDHLRKIDRMSMAHSVEARQPFLDYRIAEFAMSLPSAFKVNCLQTKRMLKTLARPVLPAAVVNGKKKGLTPPIAHWIIKDLKPYIRDQLEGGILDTIFEPGAVRGILDSHDRKERDHSRLIWSLLSLNVWSRKSPGRSLVK